ncbi:hypothetical protein EDB19DRAFT_1655711 [Suillus lakei]|nr:hypothetical protein EDB19DRAFT_1655711 [Suillus lakei]
MPQAIHKTRLDKSSRSMNLDYARLNFFFRFPPTEPPLVFKPPMPSRRINDIPFPSFSLVINQYSTSNMRLPSYRTSYMLRFHPYPRVKLSQREIMHTVDDRFSLYDIVEDDDSAGPVILDFVRVIFSSSCILTQSSNAA